MPKPPVCAPTCYRVTHPPPPWDVPPSSMQGSSQVGIPQGFGKLEPAPAGRLCLPEAAAASEVRRPLCGPSQAACGPPHHPPSSPGAVKPPGRASLAGEVWGAACWSQAGCPPPGRELLAPNGSPELWGQPGSLSWPVLSLLQWGWPQGGRAFPSPAPPKKQQKKHSQKAPRGFVRCRAAFRPPCVGL